MKTLSIVTPSPSVISAGFIIEHKDFPLSIIPSVYNPHFFKICIVPKWCDYRKGQPEDGAANTFSLLAFANCCAFAPTHHSILWILPASHGPIMCW